MTEALPLLSLCSIMAWVGTALHLRFRYLDCTVISPVPAIARITIFCCTLQVKVNWPRYRPGCGPEGGRDTALLFQDLCARRGWVVSVTPRPHFTPRKDPVPIVQEAGWAPGPVWTGAEKSRPPPGFSPRSLQPVASHYTDWATRPTYSACKCIKYAMIKRCQTHLVCGWHRNLRERINRVLRGANFVFQLFPLF